MRVLIALALLAHTAHAETHELSFGNAVRALRTDSANALTDDSLAGLQMGYAHALDLPLLPGLQLWAAGTYSWGTANGTMFRTLETDITSHAFMVGGKARYPLLGYLTATARVDLGTARAAVSLMDSTGHTAADSGWGAIAQTAIGLELEAHSRSRSFGFGVRVELGYVVASPISMTATPESGSDGTLQLDMTAAGLGSLNLSGKLLSIALSSHF